MNITQFHNAINNDGFHVASGTQRVNARVFIVILRSDINADLLITAQATLTIGRAAYT